MTLLIIPIYLVIYMPKYTLSPEKQMAILKMQAEYAMDLKMTKRLR